MYKMKLGSILGSIGRNVRLPLVVAAALLLGSLIGGAALILLGSDATTAIAGGPITGELNRLADQQPTGGEAGATGTAQTDQPGNTPHHAGGDTASSNSDEVAHDETEGQMVQEGHESSAGPGQAATADGKPEGGMSGGDRPKLIPADRMFGLDMDGKLPPSLEGDKPGTPHVSAIAELLEPAVGGRLPVIGPDGQRSIDAYARPGSAPDLPKVAIIVMDLGLKSKFAADSVLLPGPVAIGFTPYMARGHEWHRYARGHGHETVLSLPVTHPASARRDEGPLALSPSFDDTELITALNRVLVRGTGYVGVVARTGSFRGQAERFAPVATSLAERGVGLIELGDAFLGALAPTTGVAYANARIDLDVTLTPEGVENQLRILERLAETEGHAIGYTGSYPIVFDRIWHWAQNLDPKRVAFVPVSQLLR